MTPLRTIVALALLPAAGDVARAQGVFRASPLLGVAQVYDSNLVSTPMPSDRQADFITRVSPGIDSEYRTPLLTLLGRYTFDAERFTRHPELTSMSARQRASLEMTHRPTPRLAVAAGAELTKTRTPGELSAETALTLSRASARRMAARWSLTRRLDMATAATIRYAFTEDRIAGGPWTRTHAATIGAERHASPRDTVGLDYQLRRFLFGTSSAASHALVLGWTRAMTPRTSLSVGGGPRVTDGSAAPDLSASIRYQFEPGNDLSLAYARTQTTVIGLAGTTDTQSLAATAAWRLPPSLQVRVSPGFHRSVHARLPADVYRLAVGVTRPIAGHLSLDVVFDSYVQQGSFHTALASGSISRHDVIVSLVATPAPRPR
jgi:hypothetical protein